MSAELRSELCSFLLIVLTALAVAQRRNAFRVIENGVILEAGSIISVGNASDVAIDIQCLGDVGTSWTWYIFPSYTTLPTPLDPSLTSYSMDSGVLRVISSFVGERESDGVLDFVCHTHDSRSAVLGFRQYHTLFFNGTLPATISSEQALSSRCASLLPDLPTSSVTVQSVSGGGDTNNFSYCEVDSARGSFRSRSVVVGDSVGNFVAASLHFRMPLTPEVVKTATDVEPLRLPCEVIGASNSIPSVFFLKNGNPISQDSSEGNYIEEDSAAECSSTESCVRRVLVVEGRMGDEGIYQCVGQVGEDQSTAITSSSYVNIHFLDRPTITIVSPTHIASSIILGQSDTPDEVVFNCIVDAHPTPTLSWTRRNGSQPSEKVGGQQGVTEFRGAAFSELRVPVVGLEGVVKFTCVAEAVGLTEQASLVLTAFSPVVITQQPELLGSMTGDVAILYCAASSIPTPHVTWFRIQNGVSAEQMNESHAIIHRTNNDSMMISTLQLGPTIDVNVTGYFCRGNNGFSSIDSNTVHILESIPSSPVASIVTTAARSVVIEWTASTSFIPIIQYSVTLHLEKTGALTSDDVRIVTVDGTENSTEVEGLRPFSAFSVEVVAVNGAGKRSRSVALSFKTLEAAPEASPMNIVVEAVDTQSVKISWSPPPTHLQNGIIRNHLILYHPVASPDRVSEVASGVSEALLSMPPGPGVSYNFTVAAVTVARGPFSEGVIQQTYPLAPAFPRDPPRTVSGFNATRTTISIQLPSVNITQFSHFWVIIMQLDNSETPPYLSENPIHQFPDNSSFDRFSSDTPANVPYIVAEMSAATYLQNRYSLILGDEDVSRTLNDFPDLYRNGPLMPGSRYTAFVWGFPPSIPPQSPKDDGNEFKRQAGATDRQYNVFSSSEFLPATSTSQPEHSTESDDSGGLGTVVYIAAGVGSLLVILLCCVTTIILVIRCAHKKLGTSRKSRAHDDETKYEDVLNATRLTSDGTLPRGFTVTVDESKPEEHVYEDPFNLKEPIYKVPRPVPGAEAKKATYSDTDNYELVTGPAPTTKKQDLNPKEVNHGPVLELTPAAERNYANLEEPKYEQVGLPAAYLEPVGSPLPGEKPPRYGKQPPRPSKKPARPGKEHHYCEPYDPVVASAADSSCENGLEMENYVEMHSDHTRN